MPNVQCQFKHIFIVATIALVKLVDGVDILIAERHELFDIRKKKGDNLNITTTQNITEDDKHF
jgi:hypothetical protein